VKIIPVLDLMGGVVVRAAGGRRDDYRPLVSPLAPSPAPEDVAAGLLAVHPFPTIYVADLDAILGRGDNLRAAEALCARFPQIEFWLDSGAKASQRARWRTVVGSESLAAEAPAPDFSRESETILSLDFRGADYIGPPELLSTPALWPRRVIAMTLARVGANAGPDLDVLEAILAKAAGREIFAAGGLRDARDLAALARLGAAGALVASALHEGRIWMKEPAPFNPRG